MHGSDGTYLLTRQNKQHSQIKTEHCVSFRRSLLTLKLIWCYLFSQWKVQLVTLISRDEKNNASAVWGPPEAWGPWARAHRTHWIRRHCTCVQLMLREYGVFVCLCMCTGVIESYDARDDGNTASQTSSYSWNRHWSIDKWRYFGLIHAQLAFLG